MLDVSGYASFDAFLQLPFGKINFGKIYHFIEKYAYMRQERLEGLGKGSFTFVNQYCFSCQTQVFTIYKSLETVSKSLVTGCCRVCSIFCIYYHSWLQIQNIYFFLPAPFTIWPKCQEKATWMDRVKFATFKKFSCLHWWFFA